MHELQLSHPSLIGLVVMLMVINWGLETKKWQVLLKNVQKLSFFDSFKSVLAGLSSGLLTPNRIGNFIGRLAFIKKKNHNRAIVNTLVGNLAQFISTLLMGGIGFFSLMSFKLNVPNSTWIVLFSVIFSAIGCYIYFKPKVLNFYPLNKLFSDKTKSSIQNINDSNSNFKIKILGLSMMRYFVFSIQYLLVFKAFGLQLPVDVMLSLIATVFLITTVIPSLLFGKLFVRESVAVFIFSLAEIDVSLILVVAFLLWVINLVIPAVIGSFFWLKQKQYA